MSIEKVLYRVYAEACGGRDGRAVSSDGVLDVALTTPKELGGAGVTVTAVRVNGMIHDYGLLNPLAHIPAVQAAMRQAGIELKQHLS